MMIAALNVFTPLLPQAHAAVIDDKVAQAIAQNSSAATMQDLIQLNNDLKQGNKDALWNLLVKNAVGRTGNNAVATVAANNAVATVPADNALATVAANIAGSTDMGALKTAIQQQVVQTLSAKVGPYQNGLGLLTELFQKSNLSPLAAEQNNNLAGAPANYRRVLDMTATAYAPGPMDNGKWGNLTHLGGLVRDGVAAVDPKVIPLGTKLWIEGYGEAVAEDTGGAIKGNRIDLAFDNRQQALDYGIKNVKVYVLN